MTSLRRPSCAAFLLGAGLALTLGSPASAESFKVTDSSGDVLAVRGTPTLSNARRAMYEKRTDILAANFDYANRFLYVRINLDSLQRYGNPDLQSYPAVRVKGGGTDVLFGRGSKPKSLVKYSPSGSTKPCRNGVVNILPGADTIELKIPVRCFGKPDTIRVGAAVTRPSVSTRNKTYIDDARGQKFAIRQGVVTPALGQASLSRG